MSEVDRYFQEYFQDPLSLEYHHHASMDLMITLIPRDLVWFNVGNGNIVGASPKIPSIALLDSKYRECKEYQVAFLRYMESHRITRYGDIGKIAIQERHSNVFLSKPTSIYPPDTLYTCFTTDVSMVRYYVPEALLERKESTINGWCGPEMYMGRWTELELGKWLAENNIYSAKAVNSGHCENFAQDFQGHVPNSEIVGTDNFAEGGFDSPLPGHIWLFDGKYHYDSETPAGVENWLDLPIFKRFNQI